MATHPRTHAAALAAVPLELLVPTAGARPENEGAAGSAGRAGGAPDRAVGAAALPLGGVDLIAVVMGEPQGLVSLAIQNAVYRQANPARVASPSGLLRTFGFSARAARRRRRGSCSRTAPTAGLCALALLMLGLSVAFLLLTAFPPTLRRLAR